MKPKVVTEITGAAQAIGYAQGVLMGLADMCKLNERQRACVDEAIEGLTAIDLLSLTGTASEEGGGRGE